MNETVAAVRTMMLRELQAFVREVEMCPDDDTLWRIAPGVTNSVGNLALHVCGNLQHFVGRVLGGSSYVRDRAQEFGRRSGARADVVRELEATIAVVDRVLPTLDLDVVGRPFPEAVNGLALPTGPFLVHLAVHLGHHLGQAGYLRRIVTGENRSSEPLPLSAVVA